MQDRIIGRVPLRVLEWFMHAVLLFRLRRSIIDRACRDDAKAQSQ